MRVDASALLQKAKAVATRRATSAFPSSSSIVAACCHHSSTFMASPARASASASASDIAVIVAQKRALRTRIRKELRALPPSLRSQEDYAIQKIVLDSSWFKTTTRLCAYISCDSLREVDTSRILSEILSPSTIDGNVRPEKRLYVPRVEDKNSHMRMLRISEIDDLVANSMNILEPSPMDTGGNQREDVMLASDPVEMLLVPGEVPFCYVFCLVIQFLTPCHVLQDLPLIDLVDV